MDPRPRHAVRSVANLTRADGKQVFQHIEALRIETKRDSRAHVYCEVTSVT